MSQLSILIAAWYFPPDGGAGSQRPASFARHLPGLGWDCSVLTRCESANRGRWDRSDQTLLARVGDSSKISRVEQTGPFSESKFPGERSIKAEIGPFCRRVIQEVSDTKPDALLLTMSPFILSEVLAMMPCESRTRVVVDLRDPWILDYWTTHSSRRIRRQQRQLMAEMLETADGIVMNTPEAKSQCLEMFGDHLDKKMLTIENGFDVEHPSVATKPDEMKLRIMHTGTFHCESLRRPSSLRSRVGGLRRVSRGRIDRTGRTPHHLFHAARILREEHPKIADRLHFDFLGDDDSALHDCVARGGFGSRTTLHGYVEHDRMLDLMTHAGGLFLPGGGLPDDVRDPITPGKTYEYLASGRPIIAALHPGSGRDLVSSCPGVFPCEPCSARSIADALRALANFVDGRDIHDLTEDRRAIIAPYHRQALAGRLSEFMKRMIQSEVDGSGPDQ